jgi:PAS domain S-box-containing protein
MQPVRNQTFAHVLYLKHSKKVISAAAYKNFHIAKSTQDKKAIIRLQKELDRIKFAYNAIFNSSNTYYIILNKQLNIVDFNIAYFDLLSGITPRPLKLGANFTSYLSAAVTPHVTGNCKRALAGETVVVERERKHEQGESTWWLVEYSPAYDANHNIAGLMLNIIDITGRKNHEVKIELQNQQLRDISLMQSHQMRSPVCTLMGLVNLIRTDMPGAATYLALMEITIDDLDDKIRSIVDCAAGNPQAP